ncbi:hypothetical protein LAZ67_3006120 [Cordylochernes scorpioides]|uniref:Peptidase aspartic putative domain-containing protein n=1 Tax=Cordylochernes scorpioides TaxID=51811 RepID=A0ABY6KDY6_9ARAC|nr:hypothetical protein LAZ67_3006120 [Cordylochernes scorpioides]
MLQKLSRRLWRRFNAPYSPDIAPSDYHMFRSMTHSLAEQHFTSYEEAKNWVNVWIASKDEEFFRHEIRMLPERWKKSDAKEIVVVVLISMVKPIPEVHSSPIFRYPNFDKTSPIDLVIGADLAPFLYTGKLRFQNHPGPTACSSKLGWILSGNVSSSETGNNYISLCSTSQGDDNLRQFFELESVPAALPLTKEEKSCGDIYDKTFCISTDGRYSVGLPFKSVPNLGDSRQNAMKRFLALGRKLHKSSNLLQQYKDFMMEYLSLNHMELIPKNERDKPSDKCYYIPHHCVLREQSSTTKLRVVFDASCKTSNNYSLNDFLHIGPKLQHDIFNILVKFRTNPIAFTGDI